MKYPFHGKCCLAAVLALLLLIAFAAAETAPGGDDGFYAIPITDEIFARIDEVRWLLSITTNPEDRERLEARITELEKLLK